MPETIEPIKHLLSGHDALRSQLSATTTSLVEDASPVFAGCSLVVRIWRRWIDKRHDGALCILTETISDLLFPTRIRCASSCPLMTEQHTLEDSRRRQAAGRTAAGRRAGSPTLAQPCRMLAIQPKTEPAKSAKDVSSESGEQIGWVR